MIKPDGRQTGWLTAMMLPRAEALIVEREKITDYLLNPAHRYGASKERFFAAFGFRVEEWERLADALREHGRKYAVTKVKETGFGPRYEVTDDADFPGSGLAILTANAKLLR